ncbi:MAG TPA: type II toxin-antitoxin system VapC family toxin [Streptosporangiaceae bacterium]|nr:type II toxin-antitoxin system VapC family toxin [Streptosporangiaceae bacterium]
MILIDTNVWSETTRPKPDPGVVAWMRAHRNEVAISTITIGELLTGLALLPEGRRKDFLTFHVEGLIARARERSYSYDEQAARALPTIMAARKRTGREVRKPVDAMIAAVAASRGMAIATRNTSDFTGMGVELINPWD